MFGKDDDYRGSPDMTKRPPLREYLLENFVAEVEELKDAVFVGLGRLIALSRNWFSIPTG